MGDCKKKFLTQFSSIFLYIFCLSLQKVFWGNGCWRAKTVVIYFYLFKLTRVKNWSELYLSLVWLSVCLIPRHFLEFNTKLKHKLNSLVQKTYDFIFLHIVSPWTQQKSHSSVLSLTLIWVQRLICKPWFPTRKTFCSVL